MADRSAKMRSLRLKKRAVFSEKAEITKPISSEHAELKLRFRFVERNRLLVKIPQLAFGGLSVRLRLQSAAATHGGPAESRGNFVGHGIEAALLVAFLIGEQRLLRLLSRLDPADSDAQ